MAIPHVDPGELRHSIRILIPTIAVDENNHYTTDAAQVIDTRAAVRAVKSSDDVVDGAERRRETLQFIIRWRNGITTSAAVIFHKRRYELEFVDPVPFAERYMRLKGVSYDEGV